MNFWTSLMSLDISHCTKWKQNNRNEINLVLVWGQIIAVSTLKLSAYDDWMIRSHLFGFPRAFRLIKHINRTAKPCLFFLIWALWLLKQTHTIWSQGLLCWVGHVIWSGQASVHEFLYEARCRCWKIATSTSQGPSFWFSQRLQCSFDHHIRILFLLLIKMGNYTKHLPPMSRHRKFE